MSADNSAAGPPVPSPCVRNCCLDDNEVCLGCGRSLEEIVGWSTTGPAERRDILARARQRLRTSQLTFHSPKP